MGAAMQNDYDAAADVVARWEGGWSDHKADPGGLTRWGWTLKALAALGVDLTGDGKVDRADLAAMSAEDARRLYRAHYWQPAGCDALPGPLALLVFNAAVNTGPSRAARFLQLAVGVTADGVIGPRTLAAVAAAWARSPRAVMREYLSRQMLHYTGLASFATFGLGWVRRTVDVAMTSARWHALTLGGGAGGWAE